MCRRLEDIITVIEAEENYALNGKYLIINDGHIKGWGYDQE
jgi:hypothetical protein